MNYLTLKRFFAFMMACLLAAMCCGQALAEVYVKKSSAVYASPKTSAKKLGTLKAGTGVEVIAEKGSWAKVSKGGYTGYMKSSALIEVEDVNDVTAYTKSAVNMYKSFTGNSKKLGKIPAGEAVTVTARAGSWAKVAYKGYKGYVNGAKLTAKAPAEKEETTVSYTVYAQKEGAKVYNKSGKVIGSVALNTALECTGVNGNICRVVRNGKTAYMKKADLDTSKAPEQTIQPEQTVAPEEEEKKEETTSYTVYAATDGAKVYNKSGKKIGTVALNTKMLCTGVNGNVCRVVKDGKTAYMKKADLSTSEVEKEVENTVSLTAYANKDGAKVYNASGKVINTLDINTRVTVTAIKDDVCRVEKDGKTAYMKKADLSSEKVEVDDSVVKIEATVGYVKNDGAKVYDASGAVIATLKVNTEVTVTAYNDDLCQVKNGSVVGYMKKSDVSASKVETGNSNYCLKYGDSGEAVKRLQSRLKELGYFTGDVAGNYLTLTQSAVAAFQVAVKIDANGIADYKTLTALFSDDAPKYKPSESGTSSTPTATPAKGIAKEMDWWTSGIQSIFARGTTAVVTDVATGLAWREKRTGGTNHADVQPLTAADTAVLKKVYGGTWSWARRPVFVTINGVNYAASMNGMPHGSGSITTNNFNGHHCIHFTNSRTHGSNKICSLHQAAIKKALSASLG